MHNVIDVSKYIINYSNQIGSPISNLKLQKLLYFVQANFLLDSNKQKTCFPNDIEAWGFGPVVPEAYRFFKEYGSTNIPPYGDHSCDYFDFSSHEEELIQEIVTMFKDYSATALVSLTHKHDPWIFANDAQQAGYSNKIYNEIIYDYYQGNLKNGNFNKR